MGDISRPPGLDIPDGSGQTSNVNNGPGSVSAPMNSGVGRGSNAKKSGNQAKAPGNQGGGRGKKNAAKNTSSGPQGGRNSNLASFGEKPVHVSGKAVDKGSKKGDTESIGEDHELIFTKKWKSEVSEDEEWLKDRPSCLTCCEPIEFFAVGACNHTELCGYCTIRRRQLYKEIDCPICKKELEHIVVDASRDIKFEELWANRVKSHVLPNSTITVNDARYYEWCKSLFERHCPICEDGKVYSSLGLLKKHVEKTHGRMFCDLCLDHRKCFLHEQRVYLPGQLSQHMTKGDPAIQLKPHPECEYCSTTFFSIEDLFRHCEETHFKCFLCERENILYHYFRNYDHLDRHFETKHFACREKDCLEKKFIVFPTALDLQAHAISAHRSQEKGSAKSARVVHLDFHVEGSATPPRGASESARNGQRTNRPAMMPIFNPDRHRPPPVSRDPPPAFALQGKFDEPKPVTTIVNGNQAPARAPASTICFNASLSSAERSKILIATIKSFLDNDAKFNKFRSLSADYRNSKLTAQDYYQQFIQTFGEDNQVAVIFDEMVNLLPDQIKQAELRSLRETDPKASTLVVGTSSLRSVSNPSSMAAVVASGSGNNGSGPVVTRFADSEAFPSLPGSSASSYAAPAAYHGKAAHGTGRVIDTREEAFPSLPGAEGGRASQGNNRGAWGTHSAQITQPQSRRQGNKKGKQTKQFVNLY